MLEILNKYRWTRLSVSIIEAIKRQFFHMVMHAFDNSNLSQKIFAIDTWKAVICSLGHGCRYMLTILLTIWRPGLRVTTVVMAYVKSDQVKQLIDSFKTYRLFKENKLKLFIRKEFDHCGSLLLKIML